jgi:hypothetical protein
MPECPVLLGVTSNFTICFFVVYSTLRSLGPATLQTDRKDTLRRRR